MDDHDLVDTIKLLSSTSTLLLVDVDEPTLRMVVSVVNNMMKYWEANNVVLDPVAREVVVDSLVITLLSLVGHFRH